MSNIEEKIKASFKISYPIPEGGFHTHEDGSPQCPAEYHAIVLINKLYDTRYNIVLQQPEVKEVAKTIWEPLNDRILNTMYLKCYTDKVAKMNKEMLKSFFESTFLKAYNPFYEYFTSLPKWDEETDYIGQLADTVETNDNRTWRVYLEKWLVATILCACTDDFTNQYIPVLYGKQGVGKTRWTYKLLPKILEDYIYSGYSNIKDKDTSFRLSTNLFYFLDELDSYKNHEMAILKSYITQSRIKQRKPYGTYDSNYIRRASFIAALNNEKFIADATGNRRFLVVEVLKANHNHTINIDLVYSQVVHIALKSGKKAAYFNEEETIKIQKNNERYRLKSDIEMLIEEHLMPCKTDDLECKFMTTTDIQKFLIERSKVSASTVTPYKIGKLLGIMGFEHTHSGTGNDKRNGYLVKKKLAQSTQLTQSDYWNEEELAVLNGKNIKK